MKNRNFPFFVMSYNLYKNCEMEERVELKKIYFRQPTIFSLLDEPINIFKLLIGRMGQLTKLGQWRAAIVTTSGGKVKLSFFFSSGNSIQYQSVYFSDSATLVSIAAAFSIFYLCILLSGVLLVAFCSGSLLL